MNAAWLAEPWSGPLLRLLADPAAELDPAAVPGWPAWAPLDRATASPRQRGRLGHWLAPTPPDAVREIAEACTLPRVRLALLPAEEAVGVMALAVAWLDAPALGGLLRRADVAAARAALGDAALAFATGRARLMPRPAGPLAAALPAGGAPLDVGAALFGLALGPVPGALLARLRLRRPADAWGVAAAHCRADPAGAAALTAIRRLVREAAPAWSSLLT